MKKSERLGLVLTPAEKEALTLLAKGRGGLSISALVRCLIHDAAHKAGMTLNGMPASKNVTYEQK